MDCYAERRFARIIRDDFHTNRIMKRQKQPKQDYYEEPAQIIGVGSYQRTTVERPRKKVADKRIVGFVRPKVERKR